MAQVPAAEIAADLVSVAVARMDASGVLLESNAGFRRLTGEATPPSLMDSVARYFIQPTFADLAARPDGKNGEVYRGLMTIGDYVGRTRTLRGRMWRDAGTLWLVAEYDVEEIERITDQVLALNDELTISQRALAKANMVLKQREAQIVEASLTDALTGIGNRRRLEQALTAELARVRRTGGTLCALMADLDRFKRVNDRHGHAAGDRVLERFSALLRAQTRPTDIVARYGGEEFAVLLPHTALEQAVALAERVRCSIAAERIEPLAEPITASIGAAQLRDGEDGDALLDRADAALYEAKRGGRNRVVAG